MAEIIGGIGISHTPSMGAAFDHAAKSGFSPEWQKWFDGTRPVKEWIERVKPTQIIVIYNDHLNHFDFNAYPTFAIGVSDEFPQADEGWGVRPFPSLSGDTEFSWNLASRLIEHDFDMTVCQQMSIDHGIYSWLPYLFDLPRTAPITPIAVNMVRYPTPSSQRLWSMGSTIRKIIEQHNSDERVLVIATGGMSHQISGARFGIANEVLDEYFLSLIGRSPETLIEIPQAELMTLGGTEAAELSMWFSMRAALPQVVKTVYKYYTLPKITGCGVIILS